MTRDDSLPFMFTGIVEGTGEVRGIRKIKNRARLLIKAPFSLSRIKIGESLSVNGCCLTVVSKKRGIFEADLTYETLRGTNLGDLKKGDRINLERPLRLADRIGGHLVQGHVDGVGRVLRLWRNGSSVEIEVGLPKGLRRFIIPKGSIAVEGVSMTVNRLSRRSLLLVVIPHTLRTTNLGSKRVGDWMNLEVDLVGKYIQSLTRRRN